MTPTPTELRVGGVVVAMLDDGAGMARERSPRPHLHPVLTLSGATVSETAPHDHPHHAGVGVAIADVSGTNHWGGGTFRPEDGYLLRGDHGVQRIDRASTVGASDGSAAGDSGIEQRITWFGRDGEVQADETRTVTAAAHPLGWVLGWTTVLVAARDLELGSPATNGRAGAFYGGWLWRAPFRSPHVQVADGAGESRAHGSMSPWISVADERATLVAVQRGEALPWFVRAEPDAYFGPALAAAAPRRVEVGARLELRLDVLVADGRLTRDDAVRFSAL